MSDKRIILGIDPGTNFMGYGILEVIQKNVKIKDIGTFNINKPENHFEKLQKIYSFVEGLISRNEITELAIEAQFFGKNVQSMLKLGRAQGVSIAAALAKQIPVFEYAPRKIKQSITGQGAASKEQVAGMLQKILGFTEMPEHLDATDGLAVALCHFYQYRDNSTEIGKVKSWKEFLAKNPEKIVKR